MTFDYGLPADLFMLNRKVGLKRKAAARQRLGYRRFATADFLKLGPEYPPRGVYKDGQ